MKCLREEVKILCCPFLTSRQEKTLVILILLSQRQLLHSCLSHCVSLELRLATSGWGASKIRLDSNVGCTSFVIRYDQTEMWIAIHATKVLPPVASSQGELSKSTFLLVIFGSGSGSWDGSHCCTLFRDPSCVLGLVQYSQEYPFVIPAET